MFYLDFDKIRWLVEGETVDDEVWIRPLEDLIFIFNNRYDPTHSFDKLLVKELDLRDVKNKPEALSTLTLNKVDNTSDMNKPVSNAMQTALDTKVDKIPKKGLSTNDYTTENKTKLSDIENRATRNLPDSALTNRTNHTNLQPQSSIDNLTTIMNTKSNINHIHPTVTDTSQGFLDEFRFKKLNSAEWGATKNKGDVWLNDRKNHTGKQSIESIDGLQDKLNKYADIKYNHLFTRENALKQLVEVCSGGKRTIILDNDRRPHVFNKVTQVILSNAFAGGSRTLHKAFYTPDKRVKTHFWVGSFIYGARKLKDKPTFTGTTFSSIPLRDGIRNGEAAAQSHGKGFYPLHMWEYSALMLKYSNDPDTNLRVYGNLWGGLNKGSSRRNVVSGKETIVYEGVGFYSSITEQHNKYGEVANDGLIWSEESGTFRLNYSGSGGKWFNLDGQVSGVSDVLGNVWEVANGLFTVGTEIRYDEYIVRQIPNKPVLSGSHSTGIWVFATKQPNWSGDDIQRIYYGDRSPSYEESMYKWDDTSRSDFYGNTQASKIGGDALRAMTFFNSTATNILSPKLRLQALRGNTVRETLYGVSAADRCYWHTSKLWVDTLGALASADAYGEVTMNKGYRMVYDHMEE